MVRHGPVQPSPAWWFGRLVAEQRGLSRSTQTDGGTRIPSLFSNFAVCKDHVGNHRMLTHLLSLQQMPVCYSKTHSKYQDREVSWYEEKTFSFMRSK